MPQVNGKQGYVILSADFVQPALNATTAAIFSVNGWIPTAGNVIAGHSGVYRIESSFSNGNAVIRLLEARNAIPGDGVLSGSTFGACGERGPRGYGTAENVASFTQPVVGGSVNVEFDPLRWIPSEPGLKLGCGWGVYEVVGNAGTVNVYTMRLLEASSSGPPGFLLGNVEWGAAGQRGQTGSQGPTGLVFNAETVLSTPASSTSTLESTLISVAFTAPASGMVMLFAMGTLSYAQNNGELEVYLDVSGVAGARVPNMIRGSSMVPREAFSPMLRVAGLTPGVSYSARVRWRSNTTGTPRVCDPTTDTKQAARLTVFSIA